MCIIHQQLWRYKVEEKLHLGICEQKSLNTTTLVYPIVMGHFSCCFFAHVVMTAVINYLMTSTSEKCFIFTTLFRVLETGKSQLEPSQESMADGPLQRCLFLLKLKAKNELVYCHGEESMSSLHNSPLLCLLASISLFNTSIQNVWLTVVALGTKMEDISDVGKWDQCCFIMEFDIRGLFGLGIHHKLLLTSLMFDNTSHIHSVPSYAPFSRVDEVYDGQWTSYCSLNTEHGLSRLWALPTWATIDRCPLLCNSLLI
jgi:hypothetical protein